MILNAIWIFHHDGYLLYHHHVHHENETGTGTGSGTEILIDCYGCCVHYPLGFLTENETEIHHLDDENLNVNVSENHHLEENENGSGSGSLLNLLLLLLLLQDFWSGILI